MSRIKTRLFLLLLTLVHHLFHALLKSNGVNSGQTKTALHPTEKHPARALDTKRLRDFMRLQTDFQFRDLNLTHRESD
jgi:hypothetical protein